MLIKSNVILIIVLTLIYSPSHTKEISKSQDYLSSSVEEIAEELIHLNSSLDLLSITISNLLPENRI